MKKYPDFESEIEYPLAARQARIAAFLIDILLTGLIASLIRAVSGLQLPPILVVVPYFVFLHLRSGQTLGKKIFGLKVISNEGQNPSFGSILARETLGRFLDYALLGIGIWRAMLAKDRAAFHDLLSKTKVVQISATREGQGFSAWKSLGITLSGFVLLGCLLFYVLMFTSYPLKQWAKNMELHGAEVQGIQGSLSSGIRVDRFAFKDETGEVELNGLRFEYELFRFFTKNEIVINEISISDGRIVANEENAKSLPDRFKEDFGSPSDSKTDTTHPRILIEKVDIAHLTFSSPLSSNFSVKRFLISNFEVENKRVSVERVWVQSDGLDLDINQLSADQKEIAMKGPLRAVLKPGLFPKHLRSDVDLAARFSFGLHSKDVRRLQFAAMERRLQIKKTGELYEFATYGLDLQKHLKQAPPLSNINLKVTGSWPQINIQHFEGNFQVRKHLFRNSIGPSFVHSRDKKEFRVVMMPMNFLGLFAGGKIIAVSSQHGDLNDWLSDLYFDKTFASLSEAERNEIQNDSTFFSFKLSGERPLPLAMAPAPEPVVKKSAPPPVIDPEFEREKVLLALEKSCKEERDPSSPSCEKALQIHLQACKKGKASACMRGQAMLDGRPIRLPGDI